MRQSGTVQRKRLLLLFLAALLAPSLASGQIVEYAHLDAVGNIRVVTDQNGAVIERHDYLPFGEEVNPQPGNQPLRFTGKERDTETGFDYFGARYYQAKIGRFTTTDPVYTWRENTLDPQRWNRYAYARNNPLRYTDPDGRQLAPQPGTLDWIIDQFNRAIGLNSIPNYVFQQNQPAVTVTVNKETVKKAAVVVGTIGAAAAISEITKKKDGTTGPKASEAAGTTASGQATDEYGNKLGPSGKPMIHETESTTREAARNKALSEGSGAVDHSNPAQGKPHFHPADGEGRKKPSSTHHNYPE